ncbi:MAG: glycosyltransferase family 2 protein [Myxococcota bacterium]|nr:glycosyltransferase family 2 protein [Myxococcota bacterium]
MNEPVSIVVPVFNESGNLTPLYQAIVEAMEGLPFELVLVDDGSTDGSDKEIDVLCEQDERVKNVRFVRNYGQTAALTAGIRHSQHNILVTLDADLQNDPSDIPALLKKLDEGYDVACGWRRDRKDAWLTRTLPSRIANSLISRLSKVYLHDYGCTLRAYRREFIEDIPLYGEMHRFIPIYVTWAGARLVEVEVKHHPRVRGESKYGLMRIPKVLLDLTTLKFLRDFYVTPIYFFGFVGFVLVLAGIAAGLIAAALWGPLNQPVLAACMTTVAPMLAIFGVVEITLGVIAEVLIRMHFDIRDKAPYRIRSLRNVETQDPPQSGE